LNPVLTSISPDPIVVPFGGTAAAVASGQLVNDEGQPVADETEEVTLTVGDATATVTLTVDVPNFPWNTATWSGLPTGVTVTNNGGGSFTFKHAG
jgi:hypothetical protein